MKALIVGLGSIGTRHARILGELGIGTITGMDPDQTRARDFQVETGGRVFAALEEALAEPPDLAIIASPSRHHIAQAIQCAAAGCHLLIEKPLGASLDGVAELLETVETHHLFAHVGSNWKFHPAFQTMKRLVDDGAVGRITGAQVLAGQWLADWHPWEDYRHGYSARADLGGGVVLDSHEFDCLLWLLGPAAEIRGMAAFSGALEVDTEDVAAAVIRFESGALATVLVDYIQREYRRRYHISGDGGTIEWDMASAGVSVYSAAAGTTELLATPMDDINEMYVLQARHVLNGIAGGGTPVTPIRAAAKSLDLQLALKGADA